MDALKGLAVGQRTIIIDKVIKKASWQVPTETTQLNTRRSLTAALLLRSLPLTGTNCPAGTQQQKQRRRQRKGKK